MVRMGPPRGGGTSDDSTSNDSDSGSSSSGSSSSGSSSDSSTDSSTGSSDYGGGGIPDDIEDSDDSTGGSSGSDSSDSGSSTGSSDYGGGGVPDDIQDSDDSGSGSDTTGYYESAPDSSGRERGSVDNSNDGDGLSGAVDQFEDATGVDVPGEGSAIDQGRQAVESGVDTVTDAGQNAYNTIAGPQERQSVRRDRLAPSPAGPVGNVRGQETVASGSTATSTHDGSSRGFGEEAEPENVIDERVPEDDLLEGTSPGVRDLGRTLLGEEAPDEEVTDSLTEGEGNAPFTLTDDERAEVEEDMDQRQDYFGVGEEAGQFTLDLTGSERAASVARGLGGLPGQFAGATAGATLLTDTGIRTAANAPSTASEYGTGETGEAVANAVFSGARGGVESFEENPYETAGSVAGGFITGGALTRGASAGRTGVRSRRVRSRSDSEVELEDITSERGTRGESPTFDTDTDAPTSEAVDELDTRASDNPDVAAPGDSDSAVFHTTDADISGSRGARNRLGDSYDRATPGQSADIDVGEGGSELPGLWTSPDASPLGLETGSRGSSWSAGLARPRLRGGRSDQVVSLPGDDIRGMPDDATGSGYELRNPDGSVQDRGLGRGQAKSRAEGTDMEVGPDSSTPGYQFLTEEAEAGSIYARPQGARTSELEGIAPPGSQYVEEGTTAVNMPGRSVSVPGTSRSFEVPGTGRTIPMRRFERMDGDSDSAATTSDTDGPTTTDTDVEPTTAYELPSSRSRDVTPAQQTAAGGYLGSGGAAITGGSDTDSTTTTETATPTETTTPTAFGGASYPGMVGAGSDTTDTTPTDSTATQDSSTATDSTSPTPFGGTVMGTSGGSSGSPTGGSSSSLGGSSGGPSDGPSSGWPTGGSSTGGGSSSPPWAPSGSSSGSGSPGYPGDPTPPNRPMSLDPPEGGRDSDDEEPLFGTASSEIITDFADPLTGERRETEPDSNGGSDDSPTFRGFGGML